MTALGQLFVAPSRASRLEYETLFGVVQALVQEQTPPRLLQRSVTQGLAALAVEFASTCRHTDNYAECSGELPMDASRRVSTLRAALAVLIPWFTGGERSWAERVRIEDVPDKSMQEGLLFVQSGRLAEAEAAFSRLLESQPSYASAWSNRGQARMDQGKYKAAVSDFSTAIELAPEAPLPYANRGGALFHVYDEQRDPQLLTNARIDCLNAVRLDPNVDLAYYNLGEIWKRDALRSDAYNFQTTKWLQAADAYREASEVAPNMQLFSLKRSLALFEGGAVSEAQQVLSSLVRKYPAYAEGNNALAAILASCNQPYEAQRVLARVSRYEKEEEEDAVSAPMRYADSHEWPPRIAQAFKELCARQGVGVVPL